ncbi:efflux transporter outer membrane subunit [Ottowia sp.]|uniref:efflux transporter outer membrane subunit n=1 Tax=Ottowia sp. TaxID=1898956 RepID=UPI0025EC13A9|nr:efflux transporter outer membrane subunit [Ottowia sp.]MBK6745272.1 efflux transporter outer membrane subunit [Ottowia sp.]
MKFLKSTGFTAKLSLLAAVLVLAGCTSLSAYERPTAPAATTTQFKEASADWTHAAIKAADGSEWKAAHPSEELARGEWWTVFGDPLLNSLEQQALQANQGLQAAVARLKEARALSQRARAGLFPSVDAGVGASRQRASAASQGLPDGTAVPAQTLYRAQVGFAYEVDLFGRVSASVNAAQADSQREEALLRSVQLALQADVAQNYFALRQLDAEAEVFTHAVELREQALRLMERRFKEGDVGALDVSRAKSELAAARSDAMTVQRLRAASEHGLAVLLGKAPAEFSLSPQPLKQFALRVPAGLPSSLLERRPDIAAAERAMAASNARIGVAKSAFFPSLTLTGALGFESGSLGNLFNWSSRSFLLGPLAGTMLNLPIFDGGRRQGELDGAMARHEQQVALYRQQVLTAFREVEDHLSDLRVLEEQVQVQADGAQSATNAALLSRKQYTEGAVSYLEVIDAERTVLQSRRATVQLAGLQAVAAVNLIRALGGGWDAAGQPAHLGETDQFPSTQPNVHTASFGSLPPALEDARYVP